jgi:hypothetical protein
VATKFQVVFDCADPDGLARFWAAATGYQLQDPPNGFDSWEDWLREHKIPEDQWNSASALVDPDGVGPRFYFQRVPEGKTAKNRMHLDLSVTGGPGTPIEERREKTGAEAERLIALGATRERVGEERGEHWVIMRDPEGNEFCLH